MSENQQYITPQEAALMLNRTPRQVLNLVRAGVLKDVRDLKTGVDGRIYRLLAKDEVIGLAKLIGNTKHAPGLLPLEEKKLLPQPQEPPQESPQLSPSGYDLPQVIRATVEAATQPLREIIEGLRADLTALVKQFGDVKQLLGRAEKEAEEASEYKAILQNRLRRSLDHKITLKGAWEEDRKARSENTTVLLPKPPLKDSPEGESSPPASPPSES